MKRKIELSDPNRPYLYLRPVVDALIEAGNAPMQWDEKFGPFYPTKSGFICSLRDRIDWPLIQRTFEVPPEIIYNAEFDAMSDRSSGAEILGSRERDRESDQGASERQ